MSDKVTKPALTATNLRVVLATLLVVILLAMAGGFYFAYNILTDKAKQVADIQTQGLSSDQVLDNLIRTEQRLREYTDTITRAEQIVAESKNYQYQDQIIGDITSYADKAGIRITSISFPEATPAAPSAGTPAPTEQSSEEGASEQPSAPITPNLKSIQAAIQVAEKSDYDRLLHFIHLIEQNLTRMQVSNLNLSRDPESSAVNAQVINIEVYIR